MCAGAILSRLFEFMGARDLFVKRAVRAISTRLSSCILIEDCVWLYNI